MENRNIYKMDDFLIISSYLMIIPLTILAWPWLSNITEYENLKHFFTEASSILGPRITLMALYLFGGLSSQLIGRIIRHGEKHSLEILDTLQFYKKTTIGQLSTQLNMSESKISSLVKKMSRISSLGISYDGDNVTIGQKMEKPAMRNYSAGSKSAIPQEDVIASETPPVESAEPEDVDMSFKDVLLKATSDKNMSEKEINEQFKKAAMSFAAKNGLTSTTGKKFNLAIFIILFMTPLWPISLIYAIYFVAKQKKAAMVDKTD